LVYQGRMGRIVTLEEVADTISVSRQTLSSLEHGRALPSYKTLAALCQLYGLQPGDLLVYEDRRALQPAASLSPHRLEGGAQRVREHKPQGDYTGCMRAC